MGYWLDLPMLAEANITLMPALTVFVAIWVFLLARQED